MTFTPEVVAGVCDLTAFFILNLCRQKFKLITVKVTKSNSKNYKISKSKKAYYFNIV